MKMMLLFCEKWCKVLGINSLKIEVLEEEDKSSVPLSFRVFLVVRVCPNGVVRWVGWGFPGSSVFGIDRIAPGFLPLLQGIP